MHAGAVVSVSPLSGPFVSSLVNEFHSADCNLSCWHRAVPSHVSQALAHWSKREAARFECTANAPTTELGAAFNGLPRACQTWMEHDVRALLQLMFEIADAQAVKVEFGIVQSDQCRKFHVDYLRYRLITTYVGPGTEWVPDSYVDRGVLLDPPDDRIQANALIVREQAAIQRAAAGDVLLTKGARHTHGSGLVHRSPPVEHLGVRRVVLVLSVR